MLSAEVLRKHYGWDKNTLDEFYKCQNEPMEFPWLTDVKKWIEQTYDVKVMTISYEQWDESVELFTIYLEEMSHLKNIPLVGDNIWELHCEVIENRIKMHYTPATNNSLKCELGFYTFELRAKNYLWKTKCCELKEEISSFFEPYNPTFISPEIPTICVLNTKEEARKFLLSEDIQHVKKQIYNLLKPYDEYDVLKKEDIDIFVDYEEHKLTYPDNFYIQCLVEWSDERINEHHESIINGE